VSTTDIATLATAAFAAVAAGASWASVLQTRRERIAAQTPDLHLELVEAIDAHGRGFLRMQLINAGGLAKQVDFSIADGTQFITGTPGPTPTFRAGESRTIDTGIVPTSGVKPVGYVNCYDAQGNFYIWMTDGTKRKYSKQEIESNPIAPSALMRQLIPSFDIRAMTLMVYQTTERTG
jgi:hypothetical protein